MEEEFDGVFVVSDLHLGGRRGAEVFDSSKELAATVRWLAELAVNRSTCLVVAGDIVDFLAFDGAAEFNGEHALAWLQSLAEDGAPTSEIFQALIAFTAAPLARLVLMGGNHDIELALPEVRDALADMVASEPAARARVIFRLDGTGYSCRVGGKLVVCVHGNECDDWNAIDHGALRRIVRDRVTHRESPPWVANAGTQLVVKVMNPIKRLLPFVDLLKPEDSAVPKILLFLSKERRGLGIAAAATRAIAIGKAKVQLGRRRRNDELGASDDPSRVEDRSGAEAAELERPAEAPPVEDKVIHRQAEADFRLRRKPLDLIEDGASDLGLIRTAGIAFGIDPAGNLRSELDEIWGSDSSFDPYFPDETFEALDAWVGRDVNVLIAGHTHLEKHIEESANRPGGIYLNSGTWIRLIRLRRAQLELTTFQSLLDALTVKTLERLDKAMVAGSPVVLRRRTVAFVAHQPGQKRVVSGLCHVRDGATTENVFESGFSKITVMPTDGSAT